MDNEMNVWVERLGMTVEEMEGMDGEELQELQDEWTDRNEEAEWIREREEEGWTTEEIDDRLGR